MIDPADITWLLTKEARADLASLRSSLSDDEYDRQREAIRVFLCSYFDTGKCDNKLGRSISPMGGTPGGGKCLKVRWALPGKGKSGGLRLAVVAYCDERRVFLNRVFARADDPSNDDFANAFNL